MTPTDATLNAALTALESGPTLDAIFTVVRAVSNEVLTTFLYWSMSLFALLGALVAAVPIIEYVTSKSIVHPVGAAIRFMASALRDGLLGSLLLFIGSLLPSGPLPWPVIGLPLYWATAFGAGMCLSLAIADCLRSLVNSPRQRLKWERFRSEKRAAVAAIDACQLTPAERQLIFARGFATFTPSVVTDLLLPDSRTSIENLFDGAKANPLTVIVAACLIVFACSLIWFVDHGQVFPAAILAVACIGGLGNALYKGYTIVKARRAVEAERATTPQPTASPTASPA